MKLLLLLFSVLLMVPAAGLAQEPVTPPSAPPKAPRPPEPPTFVSPEVEREVMDFLQMIAPYRVEDLKALKSANPGEYHRRIVEILGVKRDLDLAKQQDPARYDLKLNEVKMEQKSHYLSEQYRRAKADEEKNGIRKELRTLLDQLFDVKEQNREAEVKRLEQELARLKSTMIERKRNKDQIVSIRLEELTGERSLKW